MSKDKCFLGFFIFMILKTMDLDHFAFRLTVMHLRQSQTVSTTYMNVCGRYGTKCDV